MKIRLGYNNYREFVFRRGFMKIKRRRQSNLSKVTIKLKGRIDEDAEDLMREELQHFIDEYMKF